MPYGEKMIRGKIKHYSRKTIFKGHCFDVVIDNVLWPNQKRMDRDLILHPGISVIVPQKDERYLILIRQYRYGASKVLWEVPAGTIGQAESPLACAKREIEEEIGFRAKKWKRLVSCFASPGFNTEIINCFLATGLVATHLRLEEDEVLETRIVSIPEVKTMIAKRQICDAKSLVALFYFFLQREKVR